MGLTLVSHFLLFMVLDLFNLSRIASAAITLKPFARMVSAMATVQSNLSANQSNTSPIELADRAQRRLFAAYVIILVASALIVALLTYLVWRAGNKYQDAVRGEANARIAEAGNSAAQANDSAQKANERAQKLESDNLTLRGQVATLETAAADAKKELVEQQGRTASLEKDAADAKAAQQRVETTLAEQQERAADAERKLKETEGVLTTLGYQTSPRWAKFIAQSLGCEEILKGLPPRKIEIVYQDGSVEGFRLAWNVGLWLHRYKWDIAPLKAVPSTLNLLPELSRLNWSDAVMLTRNGPDENFVKEGPAKTPEVALARCTGFFTYWDKDPTLPEDSIRLIILPPDHKLDRRVRRQPPTLTINLTIKSAP